MIQLTLYSRSYCHLCDELLQALEAFAGRYAFTIEVIDVDADPRLVAQFDELVPVLFGRKDGLAPRQLCHYFMNEEKVLAFLEE